MTLKITIKMDNAAFEVDPGVEAGRLLNRIAEEMADGSTLAGPGCYEPIVDINGNRVGEARVTR